MHARGDRRVVGLFLSVCFFSFSMSEGKGSFFIFLPPSSSLSSSSNSTNPQKRRTMSLSIALVPFAPLLALPPRIVAAAASCACLLGGAALGVARVRAREPRAAEVATATFAAGGASLAISAWWLLASGGVWTLNSGKEKLQRKEAVRGAVNGGSGFSSAAASSASPSAASPSSAAAAAASSLSSSQRPLALAARFASVPWKAAQCASKAGSALCPFTGMLDREGA